MNTLEDLKAEFKKKSLGEKLKMSFNNKIEEKNKNNRKRQKELI